MIHSLAFDELDLDGRTAKMQRSRGNPFLTDAESLAKLRCGVFAKVEEEDWKKRKRKP